MTGIEEADLRYSDPVGFYLVAERGGPTMIAMTGMMRALYPGDTLPITLTGRLRNSGGQPQIRIDDLLCGRR